MLFVQHNLLAENANRQFKVNTGKNAKLTEKLSSGYKINRAADDAAGLSISEKMRRQVRGLHQTVDNISEGVGYVQTAEGALNEVHDMLQRINELAVKAANGTNTVEDRAYIDSEIQHLKNEMNRIFDTTTFNERKIWDYGPGEELTYRTEPAVTFGSASISTSITGGVTNVNCGVIATSSGYHVYADDGGVWVEWTGYDSNKYKTQKVDWGTLESNNYSFNMEHYFGDKVQGNNLYTYNASNGQYDLPVINKTITFTVNPLATRQDVINSINNNGRGSTMSSSVSASMSVDNQDCNLIKTSGTEITVHSPSLTYPAAYISWANSPGSDGHDFDAADDDFLVPAPANSNLTSHPPITNNVPPTDQDVADAKSSTAKWTFSFEMEGIGKVTATSNSSTFYSYDSGYFEPEDEGIWWEYRTNSKGEYILNDKGERIRDPLSRPGGGTLGSVMQGLTGRTGLLSKGEHGWSDRGGYILLRFSITPDNKNLTYGEGSRLSTIGSFTLNIPVGTNDTEKSILEKINGSLNDGTVLDFKTTGAGNDSAYIGGLRGTPTNIYIPVYPPDYVPYDDTQNFYVQAGTEGGQHIEVKYEFLSVEKLGMKDTNVLTQESAGRAIDEVKSALRMVSEQRSTFGAYQNRLEHATNINANVEENTQAAESRIRDADIADLMMEYSINNILMQAGTSMLTQANQSSQSILELLQ